MDFGSHLHQRIHAKDNNWFKEYKFPEGQVDFSRANFRGVDVNFSKTQFGRGVVDFSHAQFPKGKVYFSRAKFGGGNVYFSETQFGVGLVDFENVSFKGNADFSTLKDCSEVNTFSFRNVSFEKTFMISGGFKCVVDMVGTKTSHHVELSGLTCQLPRNHFWKLPLKAKDKDDAARLRRLKELAENNKHHEAALRFHADEIRADRWHVTGKLASCLDMLFSFFSNYGQSIWRPFAGLVGLTLISFLVSICEPLNWQKAVKTAIANSLPFLPASRLGAGSGITSILHQLIAVILIFLIGLGLRNRFRI